MKHIFDLLSALQCKDVRWENIPKEVQGATTNWMLNRGLSMNLDLVELADLYQTNIQGNISPQITVQFYNDAISKYSKAPYNKWIKSASQDDPDCEFLAMHYQCSIREALDIKKLLTKEDIKEMKNLYGKIGK